MTEFTQPHEKPQTDILARPIDVLMRLDWEKAIYALFIILAIFSRFYGLGDRAVSHDESLHTWYSFDFSRGNGFQHTPLMHGPFLFHATAASYWLFGADDATSRLPVAILGVVLIAIPYLLRDWITPKGALFASFLLLISPYINYYSRYIRHDIYVIIWALIVFIATLFYLRRPKEKHLWWFAAGLSLMFTTKEVAFIYVAIFGSFLLLRLAAHIAIAPWLKDAVGKLMVPLVVVVLGASLLAGGQIAKGRVRANAEENTPALAETAPAETPATAESNTAILGWVQLAGIAVAVAGLLIAAGRLRSELDEIPEFTLILLYATLVLPLATPLFMTMVDVDPRAYTISECVIEGQETMAPFAELTAKAGNSACRSAFFGSPLLQIGIFVIGAIIIGAIIGIWWRGKRWLVTAAIFHAIFAFFYTSAFTNSLGWFSGMSGSLGYWLVQQEVARGSQPWFYYFFATPFYEFLPLALSLAAVGLYMGRSRLGRATYFFARLLVVSIFAFTFVNWLFNRPAAGAGLSLTAILSWLLSLLLWAGFRFLLPSTLEKEKMPPWTAILNSRQKTLFSRIISAILGVWAIIGALNLLAALPISGVERTSTLGWQGGVVTILLLLGGAIYALVRALLEVDDEEPEPWQARLHPDRILGAIPQMIWWLLLTWVGYSYAGEKMPWLSTHFVIPMAFLGGWYLSERLKTVSTRSLFSRNGWVLIGLSALGLTLLFLAGRTLWVSVQFGSKALEDLAAFSLFLQQAVMAIVVLALAAWFSLRLSKPVRALSFSLGFFAILTLFTLRTNYLANYVNFDYVNEYLVYAQGAPATKNTVLSQIEELSMRLVGDNSIEIAYDEAWPFQWYLKDYPNARFFGENPSPEDLNAPIVLSKNDNWGKVEPYLNDDYESITFIYLWWPMEKYRDISWNSIFGIEAVASVDELGNVLPRGLQERAVREALWNILFHRDYEVYGEIYRQGNKEVESYRAGEWPLRKEMRLYIRRDELAQLWDNGLAITGFQPAARPYDENNLTRTAEQIIGSGDLLSPRNVAVDADGNLYVADGGNHRIVVYGADGSLLRTFGSEGSGPGQMTEPWGITVDDELVYVTDTWNHRILEFTLNGDFVRSFGFNGSPTEEDLGENLYYGPRDIAVLADGTLVITDTGNHRVQFVDREGNFVRQLGSQGFTLGQFSEPVSVERAPDGSLYVTEHWSQRIQHISAEGLPLDQFEVKAWKANTVNNKGYTAFDSQGRLYVTDPEGHRILVFNADGTYIARWGKFGSDISTLNLPTGIAIDAAGNVYVADTGNNRILKFAPLEPTFQ